MAFLFSPDDEELLPLILLASSGRIDFPPSIFITGTRDLINLNWTVGMPSCDPITIPLGATRVISWTYKNSDGTDIDPDTIAEIVFTARNGNTPTAPLLVQKFLSEDEIVIVGGSPLRGTIRLDAADTASLAGGRFFYDVKVVFVDGSVDFPSDALFLLTDHPNR